MLENRAMKKVEIDVECPFCGKKNNAYLISKKMEIEIKNQKVEFESKCYICENCNEEFADGEMVNENLRLARAEYHKNNL